MKELTYRQKLDIIDRVMGGQTHHQVGEWYEITAADVESVVSAELARMGDEDESVGES